MALMPDDLLQKRFTPVRFSEGYDMDEVDSYLDHDILPRLQELIDEAPRGVWNGRGIVEEAARRQGELLAEHALAAIHRGDRRREDRPCPPQPLSSSAPAPCLESIQYRGQMASPPCWRGRGAAARSAPHERALRPPRPPPRPNYPPGLRLRAGLARGLRGGRDERSPAARR